MTYRIPNGQYWSSLPKPESEPYQEKAFYTLFKKVDGRWFQARVACYPESAALRVYGDIAVMNPESFSIRKVKLELNQAR